MNCFEIVLFFFLSAFMPSLTTVGAIHYEIPEACPADMIIPLNGATMAGSTFIYRNPQNIKITFYVILNKFKNPDATVSVHTDSGTTVYKENFEVTADKKPISFSLTGDWSSTDIGYVLYKSDDVDSKECYNRAATNLLVKAAYDVPRMNDTELAIRAPENCGVQVVLGGVSNNDPVECSTTLEFATGGKIDASSVGNEITTVNSPVSFRILSDCDYTNVLLYYREKCPSTTTGNSQSTDSSPSMTTISKSSESTPSTGSGVNVVLGPLPVTTILAWRICQW